jgi:outer membrane protein assembly factor BamA
VTIRYLVFLLFALPGGCAFAQSAGCAGRDIDAADLAVPFKWRDKTCAGVTAGFSDIAGSFVELSNSANNALHLRETLNLSVQYGERLRRVELGFDRPLFGRALEVGFTIYGQRFNYNQGRESSVFAFQRNIPLFQPLDANNFLRYVSYNFGGTVFVH